MNEQAFVKVEGLSRVFDVSKPWLSRIIERQPRRFVNAVTNVDFTIGKGETLALVGESGSGKSTVAKMVVGLLEPTEGQVEIDGVPITGRHDRAERQALRRRMQMIFQDPYASLNPRWRVGRIIAEPMLALSVVSSRDEADEEVARLLSLVGLNPNDRRKYPHEF